METFIMVLLLALGALFIWVKIDESKEWKERRESEERAVREQQDKEKEWKRSMPERIIATSKEMMADERFRRFFSDIDEVIDENIDDIYYISMRSDTLVIDLNELKPKDRWAVSSWDSSKISFSPRKYNINIRFDNKIDQASIIYCILNRHSNFTYRCKSASKGGEYSSRDLHLSTIYCSESLDERVPYSFLHVIYKT